jgi:hypothetical protein
MRSMGIDAGPFVRASASVSSCVNAQQWLQVSLKLLVLRDHQPAFGVMVGVHRAPLVAERWQCLRYHRAGGPLVQSRDREQRA